jgi:Family of unknown function (DUF6666)
MRIFQQLLGQGLPVLLCALGVTALHAEEKAHLPITCEEKAHLPIACRKKACLTIAGDMTLAADYFRSIPEGSYQENLGSVLSLNFGIPLPFCRSAGIGVQIGGSYGVYDWQGRESTLEQGVQQQGFLTVGVFRRALCGAGLNVALVSDVMFNKNFGETALNPTFGQVRYLVSYLLRRWGEFGLWGTAHINTAQKFSTAFDLQMDFRAINQINLFFRHFFRNGAEVGVWGGVPFGRSLLGFNRPGNFILGACFCAPLARCWSVRGVAAYMSPQNSLTYFRSQNYAANVSIGVSYAFGNRCCRTSDRGFRPYFPVANNASFLADTSTNY